MSEAEDEIARGAAKLHDREAVAAGDAKQAADIAAARVGREELAVRAAVLKRTFGSPMKDRSIPVIARDVWLGARRDGDALHATSGELEGLLTLFSKYGSREFTNHPFHAIVMHTVHAASPKLDAVARVDRLEIQMVGTVEKWDEQA